MNAQTFSLRQLRRLGPTFVTIAILGSGAATTAPAEETSKTGSAPGPIPIVRPEQPRAPQIDPDALLTRKGLAAKYLSPLGRFLNPGPTGKALATTIHEEAVRDAKARSLDETIRVAAASDHPQAAVWRGEYNRMMADRNAPVLSGGLMTAVRW